MSLSGAFWIWFGQWLLTSTTRMTTKNFFQLLTLLPTGKFGLPTLKKRLVYKLEISGVEYLLVDLNVDLESIQANFYFLCFAIFVVKLRVCSILKNVCFMNWPSLVMKRKNDGLAKKILFCWIGSGPIGPWSGSEQKRRRVT